ncbi:MAG: hypothetical protein MJY87_11385 [Fibrobacter sp.]|nr:hypothetical protein [Fibrobacter sp.]
MWKNLAMLSIAAVMFVACGGDNGSSARDDDSSSSVADEEKSSSSTKNSSSSDNESSSSAKESSSSSVAKYVCDIYTLADALSCKCDENREGKLSYNYDSNVELVCIHDAELNKWGWIVKKDESSSSSEARSSSNSVKESSSSVKVSSSSGAKSSSSVVKSSSSSVKASSSSGNSKFDFEWNTGVEAAHCSCDESQNGKTAIALYREDKSEYLCAYDESEKVWRWIKTAWISSSSSAPKSSSSVKVSSSSVYVPYNHYDDLAGNIHVGRDRYKQFTDERNGRSYYYITIVGKDTNNVKATVTIMAENLNIGKDVAGVDDQNDDSVIERYCYKDDTTMCDRFGGLYQWAEMMQLPSRCNTESCADLIQENHQGICPDGWRLMNENDFAIVAKSEDNVDGLKGLRSSRFQGSNASGFSLTAAGRRSPNNDLFNRMNEGAYWFYPQESVVEGKARVGYVSVSGAYSEGAREYKTSGFSVRCAKLETEE